MLLKCQHLLFGALLLVDLAASSTVSIYPPPPRVPLKVVLSPDRQRLDALPIPARQSILALAAAFLPYYCNREVTGLPSCWHLASGCAWATCVTCFL